MNLESSGPRQELNEDKTVQKYLLNLGLSVADLSGKKILDVGSGRGSFVRFANKNGADSIGLDNGNNLDEAKLRNIEKTETPFVLGQADAIPFPDCTFDLIVSHAAIPNIAGLNLKKEKEGATFNTTDWLAFEVEEQRRRIDSLKEMLRVITPDGEIRCAPVVGYSLELKHQASKIREAITQIAEDAEVIEEPISESSFRLILKKKKQQEKPISP